MNSYDQGWWEGLGLGLTMIGLEKRRKTKRCYRCHARIPADAKLCPYCGAKMG